MMRALGAADRASADDAAPSELLVFLPLHERVLSVRPVLCQRLAESCVDTTLRRQVQVTPAYRWFCALGLEGGICDHLAFSRALNDWWIPALSHSRSASNPFPAHRIRKVTSDGLPIIET